MSLEEKARNIANISKWYYHACQNIRKEEVSESHNAEWRYHNVPYRLQKLKSSSSVTKGKRLQNHKHKETCNPKSEESSCSFKDRRHFQEENLSKQTKSPNCKKPC